MDPTIPENQPAPIEQTPSRSPFTTRRLVMLGIVVAVMFLLVTISLFHSSTPQKSTILSTPTPVQTTQPSYVNNPLPTTLQKKAEQQAAADKKYGDLWSEIDKNYPWYNKLPLQTQQYFVYFDIPTKSFVADLYPSSPDQAPFIKRTVTLQLSNLGINVSQYPIQWKIH